MQGAVGWYRVALEVGKLEVYEPQLAYDRLPAWSSSRKSLARLAAAIDDASAR